VSDQKKVDRYSMFEGKVFCVDCKYSKEFFDTSGPVTLTTGLYQCTHEKHTIPNYVTGVNSYDFCQGEEG
jgi:hypothetical protein